MLFTSGALAIEGAWKGIYGALQTVWALPGAPALVVDRHSPWEVGLLHAGPEVVGPEPLGGRRGRPDGAGCALFYTATYLQVQGGDRDGRVEHAFLGGLVAVCFEEMDYLDVGDGQGDPLEGDGDLRLCRPQDIEVEVVEFS